MLSRRGRDPGNPLNLADNLRAQRGSTVATSRKWRRDDEIHRVPASQRRHEALLEAPTEYAQHQHTPQTHPQRRKTPRPPPPSAEAAPPGAPRPPPQLARTTHPTLA